MNADTMGHQGRLPRCEARTGFRVRSATRENETNTRMTRLAIARAKQGDQEALRYLYVHYADNVYSYVAAIVRDHHEAEDITQQVFAKLVDGLARYEERGAPFLSWLLRLSRNAAIDQIRSRRAIPVSEPFEQAFDVAGANRDCLASLRSALDTLPEDQREIIVLRHLAGLAPAEIAVRMKRSESAVHGLHHRGRRALRAELVRQGAAPVTLAA